MARTEERTRSARESFLSADTEWWSITFWLFVAQLVMEAIVVGLDERSRLSAMGLVEQTRFIRSEIADDILISAVIAIALVDLWRYALITAGWLQRRLERREAKRLDEARNEGREEGGAEMQERILGMLDEDTRKEIERELRRNGDSDSKN